MIAYSGAQIFDGENWLEGNLLVEHGKVAGLSPTPVEGAAQKHFDGCYLAPAFIDIQIYGAAGKLLAMHPDTDALHALQQYCLDGGAVLHLPTLATNSMAVFYRAIDAIKDYWSAGGKGVWGLHLEGPWINPAKKGAHVTDFIHAPNNEEVEALLSYGRGVVKMITLAPECCDPVLVARIQEEGILVSAGHSNASFEEAMAAFDAGIPAVTHLYNAMSPLQHRAPGMVAAAMLHDKVSASIIPDGYHVDYAAIKLAKRIMGERLFVITDAVTDTEAGPYRHQLSGGDRYECNGVLSGSALTMHRAMVNLVRHAGIPLAEALRMCSLYPARLLGCADQYGRLVKGSRADMVVLNKDLDLVTVISS